MINSCLALHIDLVIRSGFGEFNYKFARRGEKFLLFGPNQLLLALGPELRSRIRRAIPPANAKTLVRPRRNESFLGRHSGLVATRKLQTPKVGAESSPLFPPPMRKHCADPEGRSQTRPSVPPANAKTLSQARRNESFLGRHSGLVATRKLYGPKWKKLQPAATHIQGIAPGADAPVRFPALHGLSHATEL